MTWCGINGHDALVEHFRRSILRGRLASSYLFVGPSGIGKRSVAVRLAQALLCDHDPGAELQPCLSCPSCQQVLANAHPDLEIVSLPSGKSSIPIELLIGDREHRAREGLCHWISLRPSRGRRRVAIIDDADWLNQEGANCLLKTLEEPPLRSLLILIGTSLQRQLPTIRSRCQVIRFQPLSSSFIRECLLKEGVCEDEEAARRAAELAEGSLDRARKFANPVLLGFADELDRRWSEPLPNTIAVARSVQSFVEAVGRETSLRRQRLRQVILLTISQLRRELHELTAAAADGRTTDTDITLRSDIVHERLDQSLTALQQIDANANLATLIECWVDALGQADYRRRQRRA